MWHRLLVRCRIATADDLETLARFHERLDRHVLDGNPRLWDGRVDSDYYRRMIASEDVLVLVAEISGASVGYIAGAVRERAGTPRVTGTIHHAYVEPASRGGGIGLELTRSLLEFFESRDVEDITLTYAEGNHEAAEFWAGLGFETRLYTANAAPAAVREALARRRD